MVETGLKTGYILTSSEKENAYNYLSWSCDDKSSPTHESPLPFFDPFPFAGNVPIYGNTLPINSISALQPGLARSISGRHLHLYIFHRNGKTRTQTSDLYAFWNISNDTALPNKTVLINTAPLVRNRPLSL